MGAVRKMTAWILIGIFQVFLMHQALPHQHHSHDTDIETIAEIDQQHTHHHHHHHHNSSPTADSHHSHDIPTQDHSNTSNHHSGLLGMLFGEHSHSNESNHLHTLTNATFQNQKVKELGGFSFKDQSFNYSGFQLVLRPSNYSPPTHFSYFYNPALSHRGPPSTV